MLFVFSAASPCPGRAHAGSTMLGEEFSKALAYTEWKVQSTRLPMLRVGLAVCQITASKNHVVDGFSKLLTKRDLDRLKQKKCEPDVLKAEALMASAWSMVEQAGQDKLYMAFCRFQIRLVLMLVGKQQKGREGKEFKDMASINDLFQAECVQTSDASSAAASSSNAAAPVVQELASLNDAASIAQQQHKHIKLGKSYVIKKPEHEGDKGKVYILKGLAHDGATLEHQPLFEAGAEEVKVPLVDLKFLKEWTKPAPKLIDDGVLAKLRPCSSSVFTDELARAEDQCLLYKKYLELLGYGV